MPETTDAGLFPRSREKYGNTFPAELLEQYKLYVQSAENVSARRVASNRYLVTLNAALVALYGFQPSVAGPVFWPVLVAVLGVIVSILSFSIIKSHRDLNAVKFKVINEIEHHLPAALYDYEWNMLGEGKGKTYRQISRIELWIPVVFLVLHIIAPPLIILEATTGLLGGPW